MKRLSLPCGPSRSSLPCSQWYRACRAHASNEKELGHADALPRKLRSSVTGEWFLILSRKTSLDWLRRPGFFIASSMSFWISDVGFPGLCQIDNLRLPRWRSLHTSSFFSCPGGFCNSKVDTHTHTHAQLGQYLGWLGHASLVNY